MKLGFALPIAGAWATPGNQVRVARHAEALGYHSLWVFQRLLYPIQPQNEYPPMPGAQWPGVFQQVVDPIVTLTYVAAMTRRIRLGASVLIMTFYPPAVLAKQLATLDQVSSGRLTVGLGIGWSKDEFEAMNIPFSQRGKRADEYIACLKAIWTENPVEFDGEFYKIPRSIISPGPLQKPHPPILYGGYGSAAVKRAVRYTDGFMGGNMAMDKVVPLVEEMMESAEALGRDPSALQIICRGTYRLCDTPQGKDRRPLWGTIEEIREDIQRYAEAGLTELFLEPNFDPEVTLEGVLDLMTDLAPNPESRP